MAQEQVLDPTKTPGLRPPPGVKPNLGVRSPVYDINLATSGLCLLLCTLLLCMQLFTKFFLMNGLRWEDSEITSGVICICAPVLPKLFQRVTGRVQSISHKGTSVRRDTPDPYDRGGCSSKRSTLERDHKPYVELHERDKLGNQATVSTKSSEDESRKWEWDLERGRKEDDGAIRKTVTIDQTSRMISR
ncbi:MAG: hypothetical protein Q9218_003503 [Villophora microphyllina]